MDQQGEVLLSLVSPDGRVITVRDGDIVGRTCVGKDVLDIHEEISRRHAQFFHGDGGWFVSDLNSSNGTFVDGVRISPKERIPLRDGQEIKFSPVFSALARMAEGVSAEAAPPEPACETEQDDRRTMVVLFADLQGSCDFFQEKGTMVARKWILNLYRLLTGIVTSHQGEHIKNIGDAILAVFPDPREAARAAAQMQTDLRNHNAQADETGRYFLRIGMHMGSVLFENHDVFGNAVNIAARVQALAPPEHIYISQVLYDAVRDEAGMGFRFIGLEQLKGVKEKVPIYEILCEGGQDPGTGDVL